MLYTDSGGNTTTLRPPSPPPTHKQTLHPPHTNTQARDGHMQTRSHSTSAASCASRTAHKCTPRTTQMHVGCASMQYPPNHGTHAPTYNGDSQAAISSPSISLIVCRAKLTWSRLRIGRLARALTQRIRTGRSRQKSPRQCRRQQISDGHPHLLGPCAERGQVDECQQMCVEE